MRARVCVSLLLRVGYVSRLSSAAATSWSGSSAWAASSSLLGTKGRLAAGRFSAFSQSFGARGFDGASPRDSTSMASPRDGDGSDGASPRDGIDSSAWPRDGADASWSESEGSGPGSGPDPCSGEVGAAGSGASGDLISGTGARESTGRARGGSEELRCTKAEASRGRTASVGTNSFASVTHPKRMALVMLALE